MSEHPTPPAPLFPAVGIDSAVIRQELAAAAASDDPVRGGPASLSLVVNDELQELIGYAFTTFLTHNAVFGEALPELARMEREVVAMALEIAGGGPDAAGYLTLGGSESIMSALHAARTWARATIDAPQPFEVIAPTSIHPAFTKACHYLDLRLVTVDVGDDLRADVEAMRARIGPSTIALCGSAPQWPHHRFDPIVELAETALEHGIWMHVDACVGGYLAPFVREAGWDIPPYDLSVPGVCSMSADLHKWGYTAKPASTVLYPSAELAAWQPPPEVPWDCGMYVTATPAGTRPGSAIAGAWSVLRHLGRSGFVELARQTMLTRDRIVAGIEETPDLEVHPTDLAMVIYSSPTLDTHLIGDQLAAKGWLVMRLHAPTDRLQLLIDRVDDRFVDTFLSDLRSATDAVRSGSAGPSTSAAGSYG